MIYVIALNPSIDYLMELDTFELGQTNRSTQESIFIGGKSINVSVMLNNLAHPSTLLGFVAGFTGEYIQKQLKMYPQIKNDLTEVSGMTRINVKLKGGVETEINGVGSEVSLVDLKLLEDQLAGLNSSDLLVLTGSVANGMDYRWYVELAKNLYERDIPFAVDIASELILDLLPYKPLLIKPNKSELELIFKDKDLNEADIIKYGQELIERGAQHCIVSNGSEGSLFFGEDIIMKSNVPKGKLISSVGSGDSMVAGFIASWIKDGDQKNAYKYAVSCGTATAYSDYLAEKHHVDKILNEVILRVIKKEKKK